MPHAVLITAYRDFQHLARLAHSFDRRFDVYIHIDRRARLSPEERAVLSACPAVKSVEQTFQANWGGRGHVDAILQLCRRALDGSPAATHFHLISGADVLLRSGDEVFRFFGQWGDRNFLEYFNLPCRHWTGGGLNRLEYRHPLDRLNVRDAWGMAVYSRYLRWQARRGYVRPLPPYALYGGSCWWSLTREAVSYICAHYNWQGWYDRLEDTFVPDELYVQTLLLNSGLRDTLVNDNLRYILWENRNGACPAVLDETDADAVLASHALFARKVDSVFSARLMEMINSRSTGCFRTGAD